NSKNELVSDLGNSEFLNEKASNSWTTRPESLQYYFVTILVSDNSINLTSSTLIVLELTGKACNDGIDNDGDGWIDYLEDPGCVNAEDDDESNPNTEFECSDGIDNDGDGLTDGYDPDCIFWFDNNETKTLPQCSDGIDNDDDGLIDYPDDPGCDSLLDDDERDGILLSECEDPNNEQFYLYSNNTEINIEIFDGLRGKSFNVTRVSDGKVLRKSFIDERLYIDPSWQLNISYNIVEKCGGVDISYSVENPSSNSQDILVPRFQIEGIVQKTQGNVNYLHTRDYGNLVTFNSSNSTPNRIYPFDYSPVMVLEDGDFAVGSALHYPYLDYKHGVRMRFRIGVNEKNGTWKHEYWQFLNETYRIRDASPSKLKPGETRNYTISLRFSESRNWIVTLYPYKQYFKSLYGANSNISKNLEPVRGVFLVNTHLRWSIFNPRAYQNAFKLNDTGWGYFLNEHVFRGSAEKGFIDRSKELGYKRTMIWVPSGYYTVTGLNFPPQFMDFLPHLEETKGNFSRFETENLALGLWWGRATQIPKNLNPEGWEPTSLESARYNNQDHIDFMNGQLRKATDLGVKDVGLDAFVYMFPSDRYNWIDDMKSVAPGVTFVHEGAGPDFMHSKMANFYWPKMHVNISQPDLLSRYLNSKVKTNGEIQDQEIWVYEQLPSRASFDLLQNWTKWGYTAVTNGRVSDIDISNLDFTIVQCFDGIDNDGDGKIDFPYDLGCDSAADDSES
ncbi:MAG: hypothetical protein IIA87_05775, partial [Nanoarchaeota archaeon]|nr:hypothetical protein [Nanoarchaeota archaeon]